MFEVQGRNFGFVELLYNTVDFILEIAGLDASKYAAIFVDENQPKPETNSTEIQWYTVAATIP